MKLAEVFKKEVKTSEEDKVLFLHLVDVIMINIAGKQQFWLSIDKAHFTIKDLLKNYDQQI